MEVKMGQDIQRTVQLRFELLQLLYYIRVVRNGFSSRALRTIDFMRFQN